MSPELHEQVRVRAIEWHVRLQNGDDADWEAFETWLAEDPAHVSAYHWIEDTDADLEPLLPELSFRTAANDRGAPVEVFEPAPGRVRYRWFVGLGALAASVAAAVVLPPMLQSSRYEVATGPGENQIVTLDADTRITLNGNTRMAFDRKDSRFASLASGEALFHVRHDARRPFRLTVGDNVIEDAGTVFNVVRDGREVRVAVAEGKVLYNPGRKAVAVDSGQSLTAVDNGAVAVGRAEIQSVGAWQRGQLVYLGEPLSRVAGDLSRSLGLRIDISPAVAARPFFGTIAIDGQHSEVLARLNLALGVRIEKQADGWKIEPADAEVR